MLRAVWLTIAKEFLLIRRDRVGLFMLLVAPIAVIAAAGFSLAKIYGGRTAPRGEYAVTIFDEDHGAIARAILDALGNQPDLAVIQSSSRRDAEQMVRERKLAVVGIVIPAGTTECDRARPRRAADSLHRSGQVPADHQGRAGAFGSMQKNNRRRCRRCAQPDRRTLARLYPQARPGARVRPASPRRSRSPGDAGRRVTRGYRAEDSRAHRNCADCRARTNQACAQHRA